MECKKLSQMNVDLILQMQDVLKYLNWKERMYVLMLNRDTIKILEQDHLYYFFCQCLSHERLIYMPSKLLTRKDTWKGNFFQMYEIRNLWQGQAASADIDLSLTSAKGGGGGEKEAGANVNVFARFKPLPPKADDEKVEEEDRVTLPLHQRLSLIKISRGLKTNRQALKVLMQEGAWFGKKWDEENVTKEGGEGICGDSPVKRSPSESLTACVQSLDSENGRCVLVGKDVGLREFQFNGILPPTGCTQENVYNDVCGKLVCDFINGYNCSIIAYGQTGSGKTYTLFGANEALLDASNWKRGLVPRACEEVLTAIGNRSELGLVSEISVSYVEIYGETISDLLKHGARCGNSKVAAQQYVLGGAAETPVYSMDDISTILKVGDSQKRRAATAMNDRSSRAHAIFILTLKQTAPSGTVACSKLFMADLGGCEQVKKSGVKASDRDVKEIMAGTANSLAAVRASSARGATGAEGSEEDNSFSTGFRMADRMREAVNINLGLLSLKQCIEALNSKALYVPYQNSKLTMLLSAGLGGDSRTSVVVCGSMEPKHSSETMAAMRFGEKCALVETEARNKASLMAAVLAKLEKDIETLEKAIVSKERWEQRVEERVDALAEKGTFEAAIGGMELKKVTVLVGAEKERVQLEKMLRKRAELTGSERDIKELGADAAEEDFDKENGSKSSPSKKKINKKKPIAFGGKYLADSYNLGHVFSDILDGKEDNTRFKKEVETDYIPAVIKAKGKDGTGAQWKTSDELLKVDPKELERKAKVVRRNKLVYSGMSYT